MKFEKAFLLKKANKEYFQKEASGCTLACFYEFKRPKLICSKHNLF
jgi:hypothetical protein